MTPEPYKVEVIEDPGRAGAHDRPYIVKINGHVLLSKQHNPRRFSDSAKAAVAGAKRVDELRALGPMPYADHARCMDLRVRSKRGEYMSPENLAFLESCWKRWPEEYSEMSRAVFVESAPFGARV